MSDRNATVSVPPIVYHFELELRLVTENWRASQEEYHRVAKVKNQSKKQHYKKMDIVTKVEINVLIVVIVSGQNFGNSDPKSKCYQHAVV